MLLFEIEQILLGNNYYAIPIKFAFLIFSGLAIRFTLVKTGQIWANSYSQTATYLLLPLVTYVVTTIIAGNIALSLGMVGALSIVRFRNPVRSPLELVIFFLLITLGISVAPKFHWAVILLLMSVGVLFFIYYLNIFYKVFFGKEFYGASFTEGNEISTLEIQSEDPNLEIYNDKNLINYSINDNISSYIIASTDKKKLKLMVEELKKNKKIQKIDLNLTKQ